jgi:hypothetical protein
MRAVSVVTVAIFVCAAAPAFADAQSHVQAAKKAERRGEWRRALDAWKAAYSADVNAEYLIGIGDAYSHLGNKGEAKKNYEAYLADPLALPANVEKVKAKIASLDGSPGDALALPGGPGLALPGSPPALPGEAAAPPSLPGLDLPGATTTAAADTGKKGKHKKGSEPPPSLPGLELPGTPTLVAEKKADPGPGLALPGLELPGTPAPARKEPDKRIASASPGLELPGLPLSPPARKEPPVTTQQSKPPKTIAMTQPSAPPKAEPRRLPDAVLAETPAPRSQPEASSGASRIVAYVAAGVAVISLGGGALAFTKAGSAHSELTGKVHSGAEAQSLLESEAKNKTLSFVGFAGGLVAAGISTALFAF